MKCDKCKFINPDYVSQCKKCGNDLTGWQKRLNLITFTPRSISFLSGIQDISIDDDHDKIIEPFKLEEDITPNPIETGLNESKENLSAKPAEEIKLPPLPEESSESKTSFEFTDIEEEEPIFSPVENETPQEISLDFFDSEKAEKEETSEVETDIDKLASLGQQEESQVQLATLEEGSKEKDSSIDEFILEEEEKEEEVEEEISLANSEPEMSISELDDFLSKSEEREFEETIETPIQVSKPIDEDIDDIEIPELDLDGLEEEDFRAARKEMFDGKMHLDLETDRKDLDISKHFS